MFYSYYTLAIWFPYMSTRSEAFFPLQMVKIIPSDCRFGINQITENFSSSNIHHGFKIPNGMCIKISSRFNIYRTLEN